MRSLLPAAALYQRRPLAPEAPAHHRVNHDGHP